MLREIYAANLATLARAPGFCIQLGIRLYRIPSGIFPFADDPTGVPLLEEIENGLATIGRGADALGVCLVMHPNQFVVLNSESGAVVANSLRILAMHGRIALENDESRYDAEEILAICKDAGVPMVFDAHHHVCFRQLDSYEHPSIAEFTAAAARTWPDPAWQLVHIANGRDALTDRRHADDITVMPSAYARAPWIEVEAKGKEQAIARLQREWLVNLR
ncbi:MAG: hypothetical protein WC012_05695 [Thiohalomonadaceae bacterium]